MVAPRVLVVDTDAEYRVAMRGRLETSGYEVLEAENGRAALEVCRQQAPALVLLDAIMSMMTGAEFLAAKQADSRITFVPVIVIDVDLGSRAVRQLREPVSFDALLAIIRVVIGVPHAPRA